MSNEIALIWPLLKDKGLPYPPRAYVLVQEGLRHTVEQVFDGDDARLDGDRHVSGQELCIGIRDVAIDQFGPLARTVLGAWGVHRTEDFGRMVEAMVEAGVLRMSEQDTMDDFESVYDFGEAFACELDALGTA